MIVLKSDVPGSEDIYEPEIGSQFICDIDNLLLLAGRYRINVLIQGAGEHQDFVEAAAIFDVEQGHINGRPASPTIKNHTSISIPHRWTSPSLL